MGCISSNKANADGKGDGTEEEAKKQRRRLSVAPQHVGDINKGAQKGELGADEEDNLQLDEVEQAAKGTWDHASLSKKGLVPYSKKKVNQDRPVVKYAVGGNKDVNLFGVMDGHGEFGHDVSSFVQKKLPFHLGERAKSGALTKDPDTEIKAAVKDMVDELHNTQDPSINIAFSGTTAVFGVTIKNILYVANIGDSRCVLCRQTGADFEAIDLSEDQKPENPAEKDRIIKAGGRVEPLPGPPGEDCGPQRVWLAEVDVPGLAMSRSIGDEVSQTVGVISVPEIVQHEILENDIFAVWASDGVWEFISSEEAIKIVWDKKDNLHDAAKALVEESVRRWKMEEEVIDDITCVIVCFNKPK